MRCAKSEIIFEIHKNNIFKKHFFEKVSIHRSTGRFWGSESDKVRLEHFLAPWRSEIDRARLFTLHRRIWVVWEAKNDFWHFWSGISVK